jgi:hypothetical protein
MTMPASSRYCADSTRARLREKTPEEKRLAAEILIEARRRELRDRVARGEIGKAEALAQIRQLRAQYGLAQSTENTAGSLSNAETA